MKEAMKEARLVLLAGNLLLLAAGGFVVSCIQQLMKAMRAEVDAQGGLKLPKYQYVWTLWPAHRAAFPKSRLRKVHGLLIIGAVSIFFSYLCIVLLRSYLDDFVRWSR
jgi:hypothetical protein